MEFSFVSDNDKAPLFKMIGKTRGDCVAMAALPEAKQADTLKMWLAELHSRDIECRKSLKKGSETQGRRYDMSSDTVYLTCTKRGVTPNNGDVRVTEQMNVFRIFLQPRGIS